MLSVFSDLESISSCAAQYVEHAGWNSIKKRGVFYLSLAGGSTPIRMYQLLADRLGANGCFWSHTHIYWGDERCVPEDSASSNYNMARTYLLKAIPIPPDQIHPMPAGGSNLQDACDQYARQLPQRFDLILLGVGADGHTASLFPRSDILTQTDDSVSMSKAPGESYSRMTLAPQVLVGARRRLILVSGADKHKALCKVFSPEGVVCDTPAKLVRHSLWLADMDATNQLSARQFLSNNKNRMQEKSYDS
jgi:6-phosphogluconolactonase